MIGLAFVGFATADLSYVLFGYCTDTYGPMAASAVSSLSTCRTIAAAVFPLFAYQMFSGLGANVAASILAAVATVFAFTPILFLKYGQTLRRKSKVAAADEDCLVEENKHMEDESSESEKEKKPEEVWCILWCEDACVEDVMCHDLTYLFLICMQEGVMVVIYKDRLVTAKVSAWYDVWKLDFAFYNKDGLTLLEHLLQGTWDSIMRFGPANLYETEPANQLHILVFINASRLRPSC